MRGNTTHGGGAPQMMTEVYYTGTDTLYTGYNLCFDFNAADVNSENQTLTTTSVGGITGDGIDVGEEFWNSARRILVEKPQEGNKLHYAGAVAEESSGTAGPGWVKINRPGSVCKVYVYSDIDSEDAAATNSGQLVTIVPGQYYMRSGAYPGSGSAMTLQDVSKATTAGTVMAELQTGAPSGGHTFVVAMTATGSLSTDLSSPLCHTGIYEFLTRSALISADPITSVPILAADGNFVGQKCTFVAATTFTSCIVSVTISTGWHDFESTISKAAGVVSATVELTAANEYFTLEWDGYKWKIHSIHAVASLITT